jgi:hypothetical protein
MKSMLILLLVGMFVLCTVQELTCYHCMWTEKEKNVPYAWTKHYNVNCKEVGNNTEVEKCLDASTGCYTFLAKSYNETVGRGLSFNLLIHG